jgi:hypothetical protein
MYFSSQKKLKLKLFTNNIISVKNAKVYNNNLKCNIQMISMYNKLCNKQDDFF